MNIAVIGAGSVGGTLARLLSAAGHHVTIANSRGPASLTAVAREAGATPAALDEVTKAAAMVFLAVPEMSIPRLPAGIFETLPPGTPIVDAGNYVPHLRDALIAALDSGAVESRWVETQLGRPVTKAFNTVVAQHLATFGRPAGAPGRIAVPVAGDDPAAKGAVIELAGQLGFDGIDAGSLDQSWRQQPGTPIYTTDLTAGHARAALEAARPGDTTAWRAKLAS